MASCSAFLPLVNIASDVLDIFECPVCFDEMSGPIYQCASGHSICCKCKPKLTECPSCKREFTDVRNLLGEQVLSSMHQSISKGDVIPDQGTSNPGLVKKTIERPRRACPLQFVYDCKVEVEFGGVFEHLQLKHKVGHIHAFSEHGYLRKFYLYFDDINHSDFKICNTVDYDGKKFLVCVLTSQHNIHFGLLFIGSEEDHYKYNGKITLKLNKGQAVHWKFPIGSTAIENVMQPGFEAIGCPGVYPKKYLHELGCPHLEGDFQILRNV